MPDANGPAFDCSSLPPPIVVAGMHRSGTGLVTRVLDGLGVATGVERSGNEESLLFQEINRALLDIHGASWRELRFLPSAERMVADHPWMVRRASREVAAGLVARHFGGREPDGPWGWKDPRNALLLPVWQAVFPAMVVVHVVRDGPETARSLLAREERRSADRSGDEPLFTGAEREERLRHDTALRDAYEARIAAAGPVAHTVRYDELTAEPARVIDGLADALGLERRAELAELVVRREEPGRT